MKCRFCGNVNLHLFVDLGHTTISNAILNFQELKCPEITYPLQVFVCSDCFLVQVNECLQKEEIFNSEYSYFSSISKSWIEHCKNYTNMIINRLSLSENSFVVEIASNDGCLLENFKNKNIPYLGIEPTKSTAYAAKEKGINTHIDFFSKNLANQLKTHKADLIIGNNVLAHVPDINDFVAGIKVLLKSDGIATFEFPHLCKLIENNAFDTIYHEHYSYFSLFTLMSVFTKHELEIFDVEELFTHGGSLRIYVQHKQNLNVQKLEKILCYETIKGVNNLFYYTNFQEKIDNIKFNFLRYIIKQKLNKKKVVAFGAAAKGNIFLNYCGIKSDIIKYVIDETPPKQGKFLPQSHVPIVPFSYLQIYKPEIIIILPWNFKKEIIEKIQFTRKWGAKFITCIPKLEIF